MSTGAGTVLRKRSKKFSRSKRGCNNCRSKKKKCDEKKPHCSLCLKSNITCVTPPLQIMNINFNKTAAVKTNSEVVDRSKMLIQQGLAKNSTDTQFKAISVVQGTTQTQEQAPRKSSSPFDEAETETITNNAPPNNLRNNSTVMISFLLNNDN